MDKIVVLYQSKYGATKNYEPWEAALMQAVGSNNDWTDKENIKPILDYLG